MLVTLVNHNIKKTTLELKKISRDLMKIKLITIYLIFVRKNEIHIFHYNAMNHN